MIDQHLAKISQDNLLKAIDAFERAGSINITILTLLKRCELTLRHLEKSLEEQECRIRALQKALEECENEEV